MAEHDKLTVLLPPELAKTVREAVDGERYLVESDVVIDALSDWKLKEEMRAAKLARLREFVTEGLDSGMEELPADEFDRVKREGRAQLAQRKARG